MIRKIYILLLLCLISIVSIGQINVGTNFRATGQFPLDNRTIFEDTITRNTLENTYRYEGLLVYVKDLQKTYQLKGGLTNTCWVEVLQTAIVGDTTNFDTTCTGVTIYSITDGKLWEHMKKYDEYGNFLSCVWVDVSERPSEPVVVTSLYDSIPFSHITHIKPIYPILFDTLDGAWRMHIDTTYFGTMYYLDSIYRKKSDSSYIYWKRTGFHTTLTNIFDSVGIGTNTPTAKLEVIGNVKVNGIDIGIGNTATGSNNTLIGKNTNTISALKTTAIGAYALENSTQLEGENVAVGYLTAQDAGGIYNTVIGAQALKSGSGNNNSALGYKAGYNSSADNGIWIGYKAGYQTAVDNSLFIHNNEADSNSATIYADMKNTALGEIPSIRLNGRVKIKTLDTLDGNALYVVTQDPNTGYLKLQAMGECAPGDYSPWDTTATAIVQKNVAKKVHIGSTATPDSLFQVTGGAKFTRDVMVNGVTVGRGNRGVSNNTTVGNSSLISNTTGSQNTAIGTVSMMSNTTGIYNTAIGSGSLLSNTIGTYNSAIGAYALNANVSGIENTAVGYGALSKNTNKSTGVGYQSLGNATGSSNTAIGHNSLAQTTTGYSNTAVGVSALYSNTTASNLVAVGDSALYSNTTGTGNTAVGSKALKFNTANNNTAVGYEAAISNTTGTQNTSVGYKSLTANTSGNSNTSIGYNSLLSNIGGHSNTAIGISALRSNTSGGGNTALGQNAAYSNTTANYNTVIGNSSFNSLSSGGSNSSLGYQAGRYISDGLTGNATATNSIFIGADTKSNIDAQTNQIVIGYGTTGKGSNTTTIGNTSTTDTYLAGALTVDSIPNDAAPDSVVTTKNGKLYRALMSSGYDSTDNPWKYSSGSTIQRGGGFVGVNTTNPLSRFHTVGAVRSDTSLTPLVLGGSAVSSSLTLKSTSATGSSDYIAFVTGSGTEKMRVLSDGKVGIGTSTPSYTLQVGGSGINSGYYYLGGWAILGGSGTMATIGGNSGWTKIVFPYGNLGIGTTAPSAKLHVAGAARITDTVYNPLHVGGSTVSSSLTLQSTSAAGSSDFIAFKTGSGSERVRVTNDGKVGIGTTNPGEMVVINNDITSVAGSRSILQVGDVNNYIKIGYINAGGSLYSGLWVNQSSPSASNYIFQGGQNRTFFNCPAVSNTSYLAFRIGNIDKMRILESGNVGIGTTAPTAKLHVNGRVLADTTTSALHLGGSDVGSSLTLKSTSATGSSDYIAFKTGSGSERVRVTTDGKVGIGTTAPAYHLTMGAGLYIKSDIYYMDAGYLASSACALNYPGLAGIGNYSANAASSLRILTKQVEAIRIDASQRVGIGTTAPTAKLHVSGAARITDTVYNPIHVGGTDVSSSLTLQSTSAAGSSDFIALKTGSGSERVRVTTDGKVGIGTTLPAEVLHVSGVARFENSTAAGLAFIRRSSTAGVQSRIQFIIDNTSSSERASIGAMRNADGTHDMLLNIYNGATTEAMRWKSSGNVGIGTTAPSAKLHVSGAARITDTVYNPLHVGGTDVSSSLTLQSTSGAGSSDYIAFKTGSGSERVRIKTDGKIGIGITNPVKANTSLELAQALWVSSGTLNIEQTRIFSTANEAFKIGNNYTTDAAQTALYAKNTEIIRITGTSVGIGTTAPASKLDVNGEIKHNSIEQRSSPDYITTDSSGYLKKYASPWVVSGSYLVNNIDRAGGASAVIGVAVRDDAGFYGDFDGVPDAPLSVYVNKEPYEPALHISNDHASTAGAGINLFNFNSMEYLSAGDKMGYIDFSAASSSNEGTYIPSLGARIEGVSTGSWTGTEPFTGMAYGALAFSVANGQSAYFAEKMRITSTGLGVGTVSPATSVHVKDGAIRTGIITYTQIDSTMIAVKKTIYTPVNTGEITAGTGITSAMLGQSMYYNGTSAVDITANPQIADGTDGEEITIVGLSDTNLLTLDDGTGLQLQNGNSFTLGSGDVIKLKYIATLDVWIELQRSNN